ncbi:MAG TPA: hypothetical protein VFQ45_08095 [Longimicrobium sp.]|nr:hypothetical protein [Longimicrobium sp.]
MKQIASRWKAALFGAAMVASLGFGTAQALAAPQAPAPAAACTNSYCRKVCGELGGNWVPQYGRCLCCG